MRRESKFINYFKSLLPKEWVFYKIPDSIPSSEHRFIKKKPYDAILYTKRDVYSLEFKAPKDRFAFDSLRQHQEEALSAVNELGHPALLVIFFDKNTWTFLSIEHYKQLRKFSHKKSVNKKDIVMSTTIEDITL